MTSLTDRLINHLVSQQLTGASLRYKVIQKYTTTHTRHHPVNFELFKIEIWNFWWVLLNQRKRLFRILKIFKGPPWIGAKASGAPACWLLKLIDEGSYKKEDKESNERSYCSKRELVIEQGVKWSTKYTVFRGLPLVYLLLVSLVHRKKNCLIFPLSLACL